MMLGWSSTAMAMARSTTAANCSATSRPNLYRQLRTVSSLSLSMTTRRTVATMIVRSIVEMRSSRRCGCGKTRITTVFPSRRNYTHCRSLPWVRFRWITKNRGEEINSVTYSAIDLEWMMRTTRTPVDGPGTYFYLTTDTPKEIENLFTREFFGACGCFSNC